MVDLKLLKEYLPKLSRDNKKNEYYLSDIVKKMSDDGYKVDAYFDSKTLQMTQLKFGSRGPSLRWKTTQNLQQYDYDIIDGKPILVRHKKIGIFDGKIKERDNLYIINQ